MVTHQMVLGMEGSLATGVGLLIGLALLKYSGYADAVKKELSYVAAGAVFLLLNSVVGTAVESIAALDWIVNSIQLVLVVIAFILVLIGAITMAVQIFSKIR